MTFQCAACVLANLSWLICQFSMVTPSPLREEHHSRPQSRAEREIGRSIKAFLYASNSGDSSEYQNCIIPEPGSDALIRVPHLSAKELVDLRRDVDAIQFQRVSPFVVDGKEASTVSDNYPIGTKTTYMAGFRGSPIAIPVIYTGSGWKIDVRFWLAMKRQAEGKLEQSGPEAVARAFLFFILAKQPQKLGGLSASSINAEEYTESNNLPGGDLDQILSLCMEMPIVRARLGESFRMPSGEIVRAGPDTIILVGMLGPVEVPFQVKQVGGEWKVAPQKYFEMLRGAGAI